MSGNSDQLETICLSDSEENDDIDYEDMRNIDAEIIDYGVLEDEYEDLPVNNNVITKPMVISVVDCGKYPWYYKKYQTQILEKIKQQKVDNMSINKETDDIETVNRTELDSRNSIESVSNNIDLIINKIDKAYGKWKERIFKTKIFQKEDKEILKTFQIQNVEEIDYKRNKGLIGLRIKPKIINNSNETSLKIKKEIKSSKIQHNSIFIGNSMILLDKNTTIKPVNHKNIDTPQKASKENIKSMTSDAEIVKQKAQEEKNSHVEWKCKMPMKIKMKTSASERQHGHYNSMKLTQKRMAKKREDISMTLSNDICKSNSNHEGDHDKKNEKKYKININNTKAHSPIPKRKKIQAKNPIKNIHASKLKKDQTLNTDEKPSTTDQKSISRDSTNNDLSNMLKKKKNSIENQEVTMTIEKVQIINNASIPDVIKDCDTLESTGNINTSTPKRELAPTNPCQTIAVNKCPSPVQSNFIVYNHKMKPIVDINKKQDIAGKIPCQSLPILLTSTENKSPIISNPTKMFSFTSNTNKKIEDDQLQGPIMIASFHDQDRHNNNSAVMNNNVHEEQNQSVTSQKEDGEMVTKHSVFESQQINRVNLEIKTSTNADPNCNKNNTKDILKMKLTFKQRPIPNIPSAAPQNDKNTIETVINDRNTAAYCEKSHQKPFLNGPVIASASFSRPSKVVIRPISTTYYRPNFVRAPIYRPPFADSLQFRHQMHLQQPPPRYGFQIENAPYSTPGVPYQNLLPAPQYNNMENMQNFMHPPFPSRNVLSMPNNMKMPPGISDVHPEVRFPYPPPPVPPNPPVTPYDSSIIGRNPDGIVKKINLTPSILQTAIPQTNPNVSVNQAPPDTLGLPQSANANFPIPPHKDRIEELKEIENNIANSFMTIGSTKYQTNQFKNIDNVPSLKRPIVSGENQEKPTCKPGPLSKKQKHNATQNSDSAISKAPKSNKGYSLPILPIIPTFDVVSQTFTKPQNKPMQKGFQSSFESQLYGRLNELKKNKTKKISFNEYKKRALLKGVSPKRNTSPIYNSPVVL